MKFTQCSFIAQNDLFGESRFYHFVFMQKKKQRFRKKFRLFFSQTWQWSRFSLICHPIRNTLGKSTHMVQADILEVTLLCNSGNAQTYWLSRNETKKNSQNIPFKVILLPTHPFKRWFSGFGSFSLWHILERNNSSGRE